MAHFMKQQKMWPFSRNKVIISSRNLLVLTIIIFIIIFMSKLTYFKVLTVMVVGAGRGPLVKAAISAAKEIIEQNIIL